jgi:heat shock protein HslJ
MWQLNLVRIGTLAWASVLLMACGHQSVQSPELAETRWQLIEIDGATPAVAEDKRPTLILSIGESRASGSGGCNRYSGSFRQGKRSLRFGPMMQTKIGCGGAINQSEQQFHAGLARVASLRQNADQLELLDQDGALVMRLQATAADAP